MQRMQSEPCGPTVPSFRLQRDNLVLAISAILFTVLLVSLSDALVKASSSGFVIWQLFVIRSLIVLPLLLAYITYRKLFVNFSNAFGWACLRSLLLVSMWIFYYLSLPNLTLANATAAFHTFPIFIIVISARLFGDKIGFAGWVCVALGTVGMLFILQPEPDDFNRYVVLALIAALLYALAMILTRTRCRSSHPAVLSLLLNLTFVLAGAIGTLVVTAVPQHFHDGFMIAQWVALTSTQWITMGLLALAQIGASIGVAIAYQNGPATTIGFFDFTQVGFAVVWGIIFFSETPNLASLIGIVLIVLAGIISVRL